MRPLRKRLQLVFQDPFGSLSPRMTVGQIVSEGLLVHEPSPVVAPARPARGGGAARSAASTRPCATATRTSSPAASASASRSPAPSILKPTVVVLDEPTSALDRSVQKQIIELLRDLQAAHGLSYLFISHDLAVVRAMADYIMVMKAGQIVEEGPTDAIFDPAEDYTRALMAAAVDERFAG